ncbi:hypothetical protein AOQ84DRAFT_367808 [Glonium stellatum]|uniref:Uncharacterized protein n=1 Tax=Glonium stellatum TaxID=574774 RepID=A0A8E2JNV9_9PEZI|nr:hypothetical protein AOQ84DRAFT_367808 [Glonium stellatum]
MKKMRVPSSSASSIATTTTTLSPRSFLARSPDIPSIGVPRIKKAKKETTSRTIAITRCRAQELSQGGALGIILVLAIGCVIHMPGSVTLLAHKGLYRLAPELGIVEAVGLLVLVVRGRFYHKQSLRLSVKAVLALRHALGEGESWWLEDRRENSVSPTAETFNSAISDQERHLPSIPMSSSEAFERLEPFLVTLRNFSHARLLGSLLTSLALIKACAVFGTIRTAVLASSYYFSFFVIEVLA